MNKNKTKQISLTFCVPRSYKYAAIQPWGQIILFKKKPMLIADYPNESDYWALQAGEITLNDETSQLDECNRPKKPIFWKI